MLKEWGGFADRAGAGRRARAGSTTFLSMLCLGHVSMGLLRPFRGTRTGVNASYYGDPNSPRSCGPTSEIAKPARPPPPSPTTASMSSPDSVQWSRAPCSAATASLGGRAGRNGGISSGGNGPRPDVPGRYLPHHAGGRSGGPRARGRRFVPDDLARPRGRVGAAPRYTRGRANAAVRFAVSRLGVALGRRAPASPERHAAAAEPCADPPPTAGGREMPCFELRVEEAEGRDAHRRVGDGPGRA
jgi:hypothetical protein